LTDAALTVEANSGAGAWCRLNIKFLPTLKNWALRILFIPRFHVCLEARHSVFCGAGVIKSTEPIGYLDEPVQGVDCETVRWSFNKSD